MGEFKRAIEEYLNVDMNNRPSWSKVVPEELWAKIHTEEDFLDFIKFVSDESLDANLFEFDCYETDRFLRRIPALYTSNEIKLRAREKGIDSQLGYLAYVMAFALGNE